VGNTVVLTTADALAAGAVVNLPLTVTVAADRAAGIERTVRRRADRHDTPTPTRPTTAPTPTPA
jgi:hypothetical protein